MSQKADILKIRKITVITTRELKEALNKLSKGRRIIEGNERDVNYQFTKETSSEGYEFFMLRVSGPSKDNRQGLIAQIGNLLGRPVKEFPAGIILPETDSLFWSVKEIHEEAV